IAAAAGIDTNRGDQIVVTTASFTAAANADAVPVAKPALIDTIESVGKVAVPLVAAIIVLFVVWRMSRSVAPKPQPALAFAGQAALPAGAAAAYAFAAGQSGGMIDGDRTQALPGMGAQPGLLPEPEEPVSEEKRRRIEIQTRMMNLANANPDSVADIIH